MKQVGRPWEMSTPGGAGPEQHAHERRRASLVCGCRQSSLAHAAHSDQRVPENADQGENNTCHHEVPPLPGTVEGNPRARPEPVASLGRIARILEDFAPSRLDLPVAAPTTPMRANHRADGASFRNVIEPAQHYF